MDGTFYRDENDWVLGFERHLPHSPERVWRAVTEPAELAQWFPGTVEIDLVLGGRARFENPTMDLDADLLAKDGTVTEWEPPRLFAFSWGADLLRFEISATDDGCLLVFTHRFARRSSAPRSAAGWSLCLNLLEASLADGRESAGNWLEYYEHYLDEFGSDGTFTRDGATSVIGFERLFSHSAPQLWAALTTTGHMAGFLGGSGIDPTPGGALELAIGANAGYLATGVVTRSEAAKVLEHTWTSTSEPGGVVKWQFIAIGEATLLVFTHIVEAGSDRAGTLARWHVLLSALASNLGGWPTPRFPAARFEELRERYACAVT
jgi:uncharacterized protein YndB with AHSA1/START domain